MEVFEFREVEASPSKPSREAGAQTKQSMLNTKSADASADSGGQKSADNIGNQLVAKLKCEKQKSVEKAAKELVSLYLSIIHLLPITSEKRLRNQ